MNSTQLSNALNTGINSFIQNFAPLVLGLLIVVWVISRQLRARLVTTRMTVYYVLMALGLFNIVQYSKVHGASLAFIGNLLLYSLILPPLFGWLRVLTYKYWLNDKNQVMRKGNLATAALWIIYMAFHLSLDYLTHAPGNIFLLFDIGFSLFVQRRLAYHNATKKFPDEIKNNIGAKD